MEGIKTRGGIVHLNVDFNTARSLVHKALGKEWRPVRWSQGGYARHVKFARRVGSTSQLQFQAYWDPYEKRLSIHDKASIEYDVYDNLIFQGSYAVCDTEQEAAHSDVSDNKFRIWVGNINHYFPV